MILRPNTKIIDPKEVIIRYYDTMGKGAHAYDQAKLPEDNRFPLEQLKEARHLVHKLGGRGIPFSAVDNLSEKEAEIKAKLTRVSAAVSILDNPSNIPWRNLGELIDLFRVPYLSLARITKMLHKKRPNIIPILDSVMVSYLMPFIATDSLRDTTDGQKAALYIKELKNDVDSNSAALMRLDNWGGKPYPISTIRILDILIWSTVGPFRNRFADLII